MDSAFKQDMPPPGGYQAVQIARKLPKKFSGLTVFGVFMSVTTLGWMHYWYKEPKRERFWLINNESRVALEPLMEAERDRMLLKQLRINRDEEAELMKDVPGWEVGKWRGEPVYWGVAGRFPIITPEDYFQHCDVKYLSRRMDEKLYH